MLEKIIKLESVGLFKAGTPKAQELKKATLVYADNARGKSTLSAVLRACAVGDAAPLNARATIGATTLPRVQMRFALPAGGTTVTFENGKWDSTVPNLMVFDQGFVEQNVYSGSEVNPDHNQALLDFAIGTAAVAKKKDMDGHAEAQVAATRARTATEDKLRGYRGSIQLDHFIALTEEKDADFRTEDLIKRIANAKAQAAIAARAGLRALTPPTADLDGFAEVLQRSFKQIQDNAEAIVRTHLKSHGGTTAERWLNEGQALHMGDSCPFCGQDTKGLELIDAYRTFFNAEYKSHMQRIATLPDVATRVLPEATISSWETECGGNADRAQAWSQQLELKCPLPDFGKLRDLAARARTGLQTAAEKKAQVPLETMDPIAIAEARAHWAEVLQLLSEYNRSVEGVNAQIVAFKDGLAAENQANLERDLTMVQLQKTRFTPLVVELVADRKKHDEERTRCELAKGKAREDLDKLMSGLLNQYQADINKWLVHFGAPFTVDKLNFTYQGGTTPRTDYGIVLRNKHVAAGRKNPNAPSFHTVLSDGDKRTLALAFFLARVLEDKSCGTSIVVLDDVFASLDRQRRTQTISALCTMLQRCAQVIVLAHDAYFLRDLQRAITEKQVAESLALQIRRVGEFSELEDCDYTELCQSNYYKRYRALSDYLVNGAPADLLPIVQALRPLVEGNMHRRFPGHIKEGVPFGVILDHVKNAPPGHPLAFLQPQLATLQAFNDFAGAFHHDTYGIAPRQDVTDAELQPFAARAMAFIHQGAM